MIDCKIKKIINIAKGLDIQPMYFKIIFLFFPNWTYRDTYVSK